MPIKLSENSLKLLPIRRIAALLMPPFIAVFFLLVFQADRGALPRWLAAIQAFPGGDKLGHFLIAGLLSLTLNLALSGRVLHLGRFSVCLEQWQQNSSTKMERHEGVINKIYPSSSCNCFKVNPFYSLGTLCSCAGFTPGSLLVFLFMAAEEFTQLYFPARTFSWLDLSSDLLGILLAGFLVGWLVRGASAAANSKH
jgi:hypothetical protein